MEKKQTKSNIVVYQAKSGAIELRADVNKETIWANLNQIAELFGVQKAALSKHIKNIFETRELTSKSTVSKMETVQTEGKRSNGCVGDADVEIKGIISQGLPVDSFCL